MAQMPAGFANPALNAPNPPYIEFKKEAVEKRDTAGNVIYVDVNMAYITPPGGKDTVVKVADEWFPYIKKMAKEGQYPQLWYNEFFSMYEAWKKDEELPVSGHAVKNWAAASPAEIKLLMDLRIVTIEAVAQMSEEAMQRIGMGARSLKQRAVDYLEALSGPAELARRMDGMQAQINTLTVQLTKKDEIIASLQSQPRLPAAQQQEAPRMRPLEDRLSEAQDRVEVRQVKDSTLIDQALDEVLD
jgi:hypothetical protein